MDGLPVGLRWDGGDTKSIISLIVPGVKGLLCGGFHEAKRALRSADRHPVIRSGPLGAHRFENPTAFQAVWSVCSPTKWIECGVVWSYSVSHAAFRWCFGPGQFECCQPCLSPCCFHIPPRPPNKQPFELIPIPARQLLLLARSTSRTRIKQLTKW